MLNASRHEAYLKILLKIRNRLLRTKQCLNIKVFKYNYKNECLEIGFSLKGFDAFRYKVLIYYQLNNTLIIMKNYTLLARFA